MDEEGRVVAWTPGGEVGGEVRTKVLVDGMAEDRVGKEEGANGIKPEVDPGLEVMAEG